MPSASRRVQIKKAEARIKSAYEKQITVYKMAHRLFGSK